MGVNQLALSAILGFVAGCTPGDPATNTSDSVAGTAPIAQEMAPLPPEVSERMIFAALPQEHCRKDWDLTATDEANPQDMPLARAMHAWLARNLIDNPKYSSVNDTGWKTYQEDVSRHVTLLDEGGHELKVGLQSNKAGSNFIVRVSFCDYLRTRVRVLDTTIAPNGKNADITYIIDYQPTSIAEFIMRESPGDLHFPPPPTLQRRAALRKLDATGWQVDQL